MKTKTNKTNNGRSFARIALCVTTVLALAGRAHAADCADTHYVSVVGTCTPCPAGTKSDGVQDDQTVGFCSMVDAGYYGDAGAPGATGKHAQAVGGGATLCTNTATCPQLCPTGSSTSAASDSNVALAACNLDAGYYISTKATSETDATDLVITAVPADHYSTGKIGTTAISASSQTHRWDGTANTAAAAGVIACPANSFTAAAGSTTLASCLVKPGYYISTKATSETDATDLVITAVPADHYSTGKIGTTAISASSQTHRWDGTANTAAAAGVIACPFAGTTSSAGRSLLTECVPDCASTTSNAEDASGTCRCKANYYGTPKDTNGATVLAVTTKCTACDAGKTAVAGSTAASACTGAAADADTAASGAAGMSVLAAISAMAAAQLVL